jgi:hypothetical protein
MAEIRAELDALMDEAREYRDCGHGLEEDLKEAWCRGDRGTLNELMAELRRRIKQEREWEAESLAFAAYRRRRT